MAVKPPEVGTEVVYVIPDGVRYQATVKARDGARVDLSVPEIEPDPKGIPHKQSGDVRYWRYIRSNDVVEDTVPVNDGTPSKPDTPAESTSTSEEDSAEESDEESAEEPDEEPDEES